MNTLLASLDTLRADLESYRAVESCTLAQRIEFDAEISQINRLIALINASSDKNAYYDRVRHYIVLVSSNLRRKDSQDPKSVYLALCNNGKDRTFVYDLEDDLKSIRRV